MKIGLNRGRMGAILVSGFLGMFALGVLLGTSWASPDKNIKLVDPAKVEFAEVVPGVSRAVLWGDPQKGPYGAFTKFETGLNVPLHTHPNDIHIVVVQGAYIYVPEKGKEMRVGAGKYFFEAGGDRHGTKSDPEEETIFYEYSPGKFDLNEVKPK